MGRGGFAELALSPGGVFGVRLSPSPSPAGLQAEAGREARGRGQHPPRDTALPPRLPPGSQPTLMPSAIAGTTGDPHRGESHVG